MDTFDDEVKQWKAKYSDYDSSQLIIELHKWRPDVPQYVAAKQLLFQIQDKQTKSSIRWARIAGIAAIVGIIVPFLPTPHCTYCNNDAPSKIEQNIQETMRGSQQPTRNTISSYSSHTDQDSSINSKKTSTYVAPSTK